MAGGKLDNAKKLKADEFYTKLSDIEKELKNYKNHFKSKVVFCNCDDPETSNFYYYFVSNYDELGLKKLITTHFEIDKSSYMLEYSGRADVKGDKETVVKRAIKSGKKSKLKQNFEQGSQNFLFDDEPIRSYSGDFRSPECIELLKQSDIVVTNPPFSLFREYVAQLMEHKKKFIIIGNTNALTYKEIFKLVKENKISTGYTNFNVGMYFYVPDNWENYHKLEDGRKMVRNSNSCWLTNLEVKKHNDELVLYKKYSPSEYPKYDNYDAINVDKVSEIPIDYDGVMGVPLTFIDKYNPNQFEIIDGLNRYSTLDVAGTNEWAIKNHLHMTEINGVSTYYRVLIKKIKSSKQRKET